jgi:hypothetical protein
VEISTPAFSRQGLGKKASAFFFEKKNQKTFTPRAK